jgi:hypothetical protein
MRAILRCLVMSMLTLIGVGAAAAAAPPESGLVAVPSTTFDEFYRRPGIDLAAYRRVVIEAPTVEFAKDWLKRMNESRSVTRPVSTADADEIRRRMADGLQLVLKQSLAAHGFEISDSGGPGVLRLAPSISDLFVYAPFAPGPGIDVGVVHREAGQATLRLDFRDAVTGALLARIVDRDVARTVGGFDQATSVSNLFWFEGMFRRWADDCARAIGVGAVPH